MSDLIDRQRAIDVLAADMPQTYTPDGSHYADDDIFKAQEIYADCITRLEQLPSVETVRHERWIYICNSSINGLKICECTGCHRRTYGSLDFCGNCGAKMDGGKSDGRSD